MFSLSPDRAKTLTGRGILTLQSCAAGGDPGKFMKEERDVLCDALKKPGIDEFIRESVLQQRAVFWPAALLFLLLALTSWAEFRKGAAAREMRARLDRRAAGRSADAGSASP